MIGVLPLNKLKKPKKPLVSVIIPTYKRAQSLKRAIDSVLKQTYENLEIIVVDDNDSNSKYRRLTENIMKEYNNIPNIIYLKHKHNKNGSGARNTGLKYSKGSYITFLDDDDEIFVEKIERQVSSLEKLTDDYGAVYTGFNIVRGGKILSSHIPEMEGDLTVELLQMKWGTGSGSNLLFRKEVFEKIGFFDETLKRHQDWDIIIRMFESFKIYPIPLVLLNIYKDSRINVPNPDSFLEVKEKFFNKHQSIISKLNKEDLESIYKIHALELSISYLKSNEFHSFIKWYKIAKSHSRVNFREKTYLLLILIFSFLPKKEKILVIFGPIIEKLRLIKS